MKQEDKTEAEPTVRLIHDAASLVAADYTIIGKMLNAADFDADSGTDVRETGIDSTGQRFEYDTQPLPLLNPGLEN